MIYSTLQIWISYHRSKEAHFCFQDSILFSLFGFQDNFTITYKPCCFFFYLESHILWVVYEPSGFPRSLCKPWLLHFHSSIKLNCIVGCVATDTLQSTDIIWQDATDINTGVKKEVTFHWALIFLVLVTNSVIFNFKEFIFVIKVNLQCCVRFR